MPNAKLAALQSWMNLKGVKPQVAVDGVAGPKTREAFLALFANQNAPRITQTDIDAFADRLGCTVRQLSAVATVESGGGAFLPSGHPKILWERHYFFKRLHILIPFISDPAPGGYTIDANRNNINDSWEKLCDAAMRSPAYAFESCSWGKFQIMGAWWEKLGYSSAAEFAWSMRESEVGHYEAFVRYVEKFGLVPALRAIDENPFNARPFARGYNGKNYTKFSYDIKIANAYRRLV